MHKKNKVANLLYQAKECLERGDLFVSIHAEIRLRERGITQVDLNYVIRNGYHEKSKDFYDNFHQSWNYSIRGKTIDERDLRVVVSLDANLLLVITAIEVGT